MNFLAHLYLAGPADGDRLGALLGDFVKGPLPAGLPGEVAAGVALHRAIDAFADTHPAFVASRARVSAERRRVSGIMIDLFYDHFLARHWSEFHAQPLPDFTAEAYTLLARHAPLLPERLARILPRMRADDWLTSYQSVESIREALDRMAMRLSRPEALTGAGHELLAGYPGFETDFMRFLPDALAYAQSRRARRA